MADVSTPPCQPPVAGPTTTPFWRTELHELDSLRSTEELPSKCDLVIIGAGYAGVSTAYHLLAGKKSPASVVMLEAREVSSGASGRNGGHIKPDVYYNILKYSRKYGAEQAASFARFEAANVLAVKEAVEREGIDCDFVLTRALDVYLDDEHARQTEEAYRELKRVGAADLGDVQLLRGMEAERLSGVKGAKTVFSFTAAHLWPYKLVLGLLSRLVANPETNLNVQTHTPVTSVSTNADPQTGRWTVTTARGVVAAKKVVFATNGYTASLAPQFHARIVPVRGICSHIVPSRPEWTARLAHSYSLRYGRGVYDYAVPRLDGSVVIGGAKPRFWHDRSQWYGVTDDAALIAPAAEYFDDVLQQRFAGWEDSGARPESIWTGIMGWTSDFMPHIGEVPGKPGQFIIAGFSGHGMPIIWLAAKAMADMLDGTAFEDTGLPKIFKPTEERLADNKNEILGI